MKMPNPAVIYDDLARSFAKTLDRMGKGEREDGNERRRQITLHSFRRFVKTTISDLDMPTFLNILSDILALPIGVRKIQRKQRYFSRLNLILPS